MNFRRLTYLTISSCVLSLSAQENSLYLEPPSVPDPAPPLTNFVTSLILTNAAASNGRDFLIAWSENRASTNSLSAARISADGTLADRYPIHIATSLRANKPILLASLGEDFLISFDNSPGVPINGKTIYSSQKLLWLRSSGTLSGHPGMQLFDSSSVPTIPAAQLLSGPQTALLVTPAFSSAGTYRLIFDHDQLGPEFPISTAQALPASFSGAASRNGFMVAWRVGNLYRVSRISPKGELLDPNGISLPYSAPPSIAGNDDSWLLVFQSSATCMKISADGAVFNSLPISLPFASSPAPLLLSGVGDSWEAASIFNNQPIVHQFSPSLDLLRRTVTPGITNAGASFARNTEGDYLITWASPNRISQNRLFYAIKPHDAPLTPIQNISLRCIEPKAALSRSASEFALLSLEFQSPSLSSFSFQFQRLDLQGHPLSPPIQLQTFTNLIPYYSTNFGLAAGSIDDTHLLVVGSPGKLTGYLVGPDDQFPVFATFQTGEGSQSPTMTYSYGAPIHISRSQNEFLVSWAKYWELAIFDGANIMRVSQSGRILAQKSFFYQNMNWANLDGKLLAFYQLGSPPSITFGTTELSLTNSSLFSLPPWPGSQPKLTFNENGSFATWELSTNNLKVLRASYFTQIPTNQPPSLELFRFNYPAAYSLAASDHGYLIYGSEQPPVSYGNLPEGRTFAFYYEAATGKILSNIVEGVGQFASPISIAGGQSDFLATYSSSYDGLQAVTQWIRPTQTSLLLTAPKVRRGRLTTTFNATLDRDYQIEASSDLINWRPVADLTGSGSYNLSTETTAPQTFFRALPTTE